MKGPTSASRQRALTQWLVAVASCLLGLTISGSTEAVVGTNDIPPMASEHLLKGLLCQGGMVTIPLGKPFVCNSTRKIVKGNLLTDSMHVTVTVEAISQERACCKTHYGFFGDYAADMNTQHQGPPQVPRRLRGQKPCEGRPLCLLVAHQGDYLPKYCHKMKSKAEVKGDSMLGKRTSHIQFESLRTARWKQRLPPS
jgi:hypothetical protein